MQRSTSYNLDACSQGPTGTRRVKGGVSAPAEDLRPVSEVESGVNFRPVAGPGCCAVSREATRTRFQEVSWGCGDTFGPPGGSRYPIRVTWTWICNQAIDGLEEGVLDRKNGDARAHMLPANLEHLRVEWRKRGTYETAWVTPGHDCLCSYACGHGAAVRPNDPIWDGRQSRSPLVFWVCKRESANGSELEPVRQSKIMHPLTQR